MMMRFEIEITRGTLTLNFLYSFLLKLFNYFSDKRYVPGVDCFVNGVPKSVSKTVKIFEISEAQWPSHVQGVPKESEAFVRFMVHVSRWKRRSLYTDGTGINGKRILIVRFKLLRLN